MADIKIDSQRSGINLDADPSTPGVQIDRGTVDGFVNMPRIYVEDYLRRIDSPSWAALKKEVNRTAALAPPGKRVTFEDVRMAGHFATQTIMPREQFPAKIRIEQGKDQTKVAFDWSNNKTEHVFDIADSYTLTLTRDNMLLLNRKDGAPFTGPGQQPGSEPVDHVLFVPDRDPVRGVGFMYEASYPEGSFYSSGHDVAGLKQYLSELR